MAQVPKLADVPDEQDRRAFLLQLVDQLQPDERRFLALTISRKNDRMAALPIELVMHILAHLPLTYAWTLRLVCKQWRDLFCSGHVVDEALKRWDTHVPEDRIMTLHRTKGAHRTLRRLQSWRLGRPFTQCVKLIGISNSNGEPLLQATRTYALAGQYFAYIEALPGEGHRVIVSDLLKGTRTRYQGAARENIMCLGLTNSVIAYISFNGKLYTSKHDQSQLGSVQLPSAGVQAFGADRDTIGIVVSAAANREAATLIVYDCGTRIMRDFQVEVPKIQVDLNTVARCSIRVLLVSTEAQTVDIFAQHYLTTDAARESQNAYVEHRRYSFGGEHLSSSSWERLGTRRRPSGQSHFFNLTDLHRTGVHGVHAFRTQLLQSSDQLSVSTPGKPPLKMLLCFDSVKATLVEHTFPGDYQRLFTRSHDIESPSDYVFPMLWKNVEVRADPVLYLSTQTERNRYVITNRLELESKKYERWSQVLVNESFIMVMSWSSPAEAWRASFFCFESGIQWGMPGVETISTGLWEDQTTDASI